MVKVMMWKAPAQREYAPKPLDPGQRITWTLATEAVWPQRSEIIERAGEIWSAGPLPGSVWARPDGSADVVAVKLPSAMRAAEMPAYGRQWQADTARRCNHLSVMRGMVTEFATELHYEYGRGNVERARTVAYHCDPDCPAIAHETRPSSEWEATVASVIRMLLDKTCNGRWELCRTCIYLDQPEAASEARAA